MSTAESRPEVPTWSAVAIVLLVAALATYLVFLGGPAMELFVVGYWAFGLSLTLFVVYLLYRFVVAVETIAEKH